MCYLILICQSQKVNGAIFAIFLCFELIYQIKPFLALRFSIFYVLDIENNKIVHE